MVKCPGCGAGMRFDPITGKLICDYCDSMLSPEEAEISREARAEVDITSDNVSADTVDITQDTYETYSYSCPDCGATIYKDNDTAVTFCNYCGNSVTLESRLCRLKKPSQIIPFKKTITEAKSSYKRMISGAIFAPNRLLSDTNVDKFRGIYMPYWSYGFKSKANVRILAHHDKRSGEYIYTDNYAFNGSYEAEYDGISFDASSSFSDRFSNAIAPFNVEDSVPFSESYMAGFYADAGDIDSSPYRENAKDIIIKDIEKSALKRPELKSFTINQNGITHIPVSKEDKESLSYYPVWFLANKYGNKVSYAVVNGQTGEIAADIPISYPKFIIGTFMLALPLILFFNTIMTLRHTTLLILTIIFSLISLFIASSLADSLYIRNNYFDDIGMQIRKFGNVQNLNIFKKTKSNKSPWTSVLRTSLAFLFVPMFMLSIFLKIPNDAIMILSILYSIIAKIILDYLVDKEKHTFTKSVIVIRQPLDEKLKYILKQIIAIILCIVILIISPTMDFWYYGAALIAMGLTLLSFYDLVDLHNKLALRLPPQFKRRGGDM